MSISPVANLSSDPSPDLSGSPSATTSATEHKYSPITEPVAKRETASPPSSAPASTIPEDEVELQHDPELKSDFIVKYLDASGRLVLQVPSEQMLDVERGIAEELQQSQWLQEKGGSRGH